MSRRLQLLILATLMAVAVGCGRGDNGGRQPQPSDTLYTGEAAMAIYYQEPERALAIIDSAELVGNITADAATYLRAKVYSQSGAVWPLDTARLMLESLLEIDSIYDNPRKREKVLDLLVYVARMRHDNARYLQWATEKVELCRENGYETEALRTEAEIANLLCQMGEEEKGLAKMDGIIANLDGQRHFNEMDACIIALKRKVKVLSDFGQMAEIVPLAHRIVAKVSDYRQHPEIYDDGSFRQPPTDDQFNKYCDFYTDQAYCQLARAYAELGTYDLANYYAGLTEESDYAKSLGGMLNMAIIYRLLGQYDKMLGIYDDITFYESDTVNSGYASMLFGRACAAEAAADYRTANNYLHRYNTLQESIGKAKLKNRTYEYATRYHLKEERLNAERERMRASHNMHLAVWGFSLALGFCISALWLLGQHRALRRKDRVLVEQIAEAVKLRAAENVEPESDSAPNAAPTSPEDMSDKELYIFLCDAIRNEKLYLDPSFGRQSLVDRYKITDRRIGAAFAHGNGLPDYVRELRLDHACRLLAEQPDMCIGDIGSACGFSSLSVFSREFKRKFDVTPTYYRTEMTSGV